MESHNIYISQWRPNEYIEMTLITEGTNSPNLKISDREIKDSSITYSVYSIEEKKQKRIIIDYLPKIIADIFKWLVIFVISMLIIGLSINIPDQLKQIPLKQKLLTLIIWVFILFIIASPILWMFKI